MTLLVTSAAGANGAGYGKILAFADDGKPIGVFGNDARIVEPFPDGLEVYALVDAQEPVSEENVDTDLWAFLRWMIRGIGGEWKVEDLDVTGRLYQLPFLSGRG
jgi:hypothetical protein